jgi:hypothetical protein
MRLLIGMGLLLAFAVAAPAQGPALVRSAKNGAWSDAATWDGGKVPGAGARVQVREGHRVVYDAHGEEVIRFIHVAGTLTFAPDRDTRLNVGLLKIQAGNEASEDGFECDAHLPKSDPGKPRAALEVGTLERPVVAKHTALIRLVYVEGMDRQSCPAVVCCGGRMDFHGAHMSRTWVRLGAPAKAGDATVTLEAPVTGWKAGDRIILTGTTRQNKSLKTFKPSVKDATQTEERIVKAIDGDKLTLDRALEFDHVAKDAYRGNVANLSRNVVVESANPDARGHTMYHRNSAGSIAYAEFRHLGMPGVLGRYSLHYHVCADTMRGSSVIGASIWDSGNRWLTIHGTNYLVVRDCVGYQSLGHGFFLEDATEVYNVLDRNLAVQAYTAKPLPKQVLPFDPNDGAGFWWANSLNTFTRNVASECDEYGYFFQVIAGKDFDPVLPIQQADGSRKKVDVRTLPFVRFEDNEAHCQRRHAFNLGGGVPFGPGVAGIGPDVHHPFVIRNFRSWNVHWAIHTVAPSVLIDNLDIFHANYGIWRPVYKDHAYRNVKLAQIAVKPEFSPQGVKPIESDFPRPLDLVDDLPPQTIITHFMRGIEGQVVLRGTTADNGTVRRVLVNQQEARALRPNFAEWEALVPAGATIVAAHAEDAAGNIEPRPHRMSTSR